MRDLGFEQIKLQLQWQRQCQVGFLLLKLLVCQSFFNIFLFSLYYFDGEI